MAKSLQELLTRPLLSDVTAAYEKHKGTEVGDRLHEYIVKRLNTPHEELIENSNTLRKALYEMEMADLQRVDDEISGD